MLQTGKMIATEFKNGSYKKISELAEFRENLNKSYHNSLVAVENTLLKIFLAPTFQKSLLVSII